jgi:hypothetical protein
VARGLLDKRLAGCSRHGYGHFGRGIVEGLMMTPLAPLSAGLQVISSWLMSVLAILAILVSVILCMTIAEFVLERGALTQAYTVKINASAGDRSSPRDQNEL